MSEKITLKFSGTAVAFVGRDARKEEKLRAARGEIALSITDLGNLLLLFSQDRDQEVRAAALKSMKELPHDVLKQIAASSDVHPKMVELLVRLHPEVALSIAALSTEELPGSESVDGTSGGETPEPDETSADSSGDAGEEVDEESEEFLSKYKLSMQLSIADKIKYALTADKEWRSILIKDSNKLVSGAVMKNPRITEAEVLAIAKSKIQNDDIIRIICMNREWLKNYQIRKSLVYNNKTPVAKAIRYMSTLTEKDLAGLAKSKNVTTVISTQARRLLMGKNKG